MSGQVFNPNVNNIHLTDREENILKQCENENPQTYQKLKSSEITVHEALLSQCCQNSKTAWKTLTMSRINLSKRIHYARHADLAMYNEVATDYKQCIGGLGGQEPWDGACNLHKSLDQNSAYRIFTKDIWGRTTPVRNSLSLLYTVNEFHKYFYDVVDVLTPIHIVCNFITKTPFEEFKDFKRMAHQILRDLNRSNIFHGDESTDKTIESFQTEGGTKKISFPNTQFSVSLEEEFVNNVSSNNVSSHTSSMRYQDILSCLKESSQLFRVILKFYDGPTLLIQIFYEPVCFPYQFPTDKTTKLMENSLTDCSNCFASGDESIKRNHEGHRQCILVDLNANLKDMNSLTKSDMMTRVFSLQLNTAKKFLTSHESLGRKLDTKTMSVIPSIKSCNFRNSVGTFQQGNGTWIAVTVTSVMNLEVVWTKNNTHVFQKDLFLKTKYWLQSKNSFYTPPTLLFSRPRDKDYHQNPLVETFAQISDTNGGGFGGISLSASPMELKRQNIPEGSMRFRKITGDAETQGNSGEIVTTKSAAKDVKNTQESKGKPCSKPPVTQAEDMNTLQSTAVKNTSVRSTKLVKEQAATSERSLKATLPLQGSTKESSNGDGCKMHPLLSAVNALQPGTTPLSTEQLVLAARGRFTTGAKKAYADLKAKRHDDRVNQRGTQTSEVTPASTPIEDRHSQKRVKKTDETEGVAKEPIRIKNRHNKRLGKAAVQYLEVLTECMKSSQVNPKERQGSFRKREDVLYMQNQTKIPTSYILPVSDKSPLKPETDELSLGAKFPGGNSDSIETVPMSSRPCEVMQGKAGIFHSKNQVHMPMPSEFRSQIHRHVIPARCMTQTSSRYHAHLHMCKMSQNGAYKRTFFIE